MEHVFKRSASEASLEDASSGSRTQPKSSAPMSNEDATAGISTDAAAQEQSYGDFDKRVDEKLSLEPERSAYAVAAAILEIGLHRSPTWGEFQGVIKDPQCNTLLLDAMKNHSYYSVLQHMIKILAIELPRLDKANKFLTSGQDKASATASLLSWNYPYEGDAVACFASHIQYYLKRSKFYAPYVSIIQSSGCGKSRLADEFSKHHFSIPMNLRSPQAKSFPPSDEVLYRYFLQIPLKAGQGAAFVCMSAFIVALLETTKEAVGHWPRDSDESVAQWFRRKMTEGQQWGATNAYRTRFFQDVVHRATVLAAHGKPTLTGSPRVEFPGSETNDAEGAASQLLEALKLPAVSQFPQIFLAFDEAHTLMRGESFDSGAVEDNGWTLFSELQIVLRTLRNFSTFAVFLSTTGRISQFSPPNAVDPSNRVAREYMITMPPYCLLGFDQLALPLPVPLTLKSVACKDYQMRLGRVMFSGRWRASNDDRMPLAQRNTIKTTMINFAAEKVTSQSLASKLTCSAQLACLSWRLPIEFLATHSPTYEDEIKQVANHMRVCLSVDSSFDRMDTLCPSEPLLAEGAASVMQVPDFDPVGSMSMALQGFSIHQGDKGEMLAMFLLILARDDCVQRSIEAQLPGSDLNVFKVTEFLHSLLRQPTPTSNPGSASVANVLTSKPSVYQPARQNQTLEEAFENVYLFFNHFLKRSVHNGFSEFICQMLISRNAAVLGANGQPGFDILLFTIEGDLCIALTDKTLGIILLQVKLDQRYSDTIDSNLFAEMDPVALGLVRTGEQLQVPVIRIVFALASKTPAIKVSTSQTPGNFTAYDIWVSGLSSEVFAPIQEGEVGKWQAIRDYLYQRKGRYHAIDKRSMALKQTMNPATSNEPAFVSFTGGGVQG